MEKIDEMLQENPTDHGCNVWDGPSLSAVIKRTFGVDIGVRQCQRIFRLLGYSRIRPQTHPSKGCEDADAREAYKKKKQT